MLEYVDAWRQRILDNDGIIPTNIGLDGKIGSAAGGKWYGGVYGWGFTVDGAADRQAGPPQQPLPRPRPASATPTCSPATTAGSTRGGKMIDKVNAQGKTTTAA